MGRTKHKKIKLTGSIGKSRLFFLIFSVTIFVQTASCQDTAKRQDNTLNNKAQELTSWGSQFHITQSLVPAFFEKQETIGSPYLTPNWVPGVLELTDHRRIPGQNEYLYFDYDKYNLRLVLINKENKISSYPVDSISGFVLVDSNKTYSFEKVSAIGDHILVQPLIKSRKGYSLYKRLITRLIVANYVSMGYSSEGEKYDEYVDEYEYYLVYPYKVTYKKFYLKEKPVCKIVKDICARPDDFFTLNKHSITEQDLVSFVETINHAYPEKKK
jgi:hypothetical protein